MNGRLYREYLDWLIHEHNVDEVYMAGSCVDDELAAYYRVAHVFVCMSEHEGFCVPLIEAMTVGIPVVAFDAAAVPETMGKAGVLAHNKRFEVLAEVVEMLASKTDLRDRVIAAQHDRTKVFRPESVEASLRQVIRSIVAD